MSVDILPLSSSDSIQENDKTTTVLITQKDTYLGNNTLTLCNSFGVYGFSKNKALLRVCQQQKLYAIQLSKASQSFNIVKQLELKNGDVAYSNDKVHITLKQDKLNAQNDQTSLKAIVVALKQCNTQLFTALAGLKVIDPISGELPLSPSSITAINNAKQSYVDAFTTIEKLIA